jgi:hypothetical protein
MGMIIELFLKNGKSFSAFIVLKPMGFQLAIELEHIRKYYRAVLIFGAVLVVLNRLPVNGRPTHSTQLLGDINLVNEYPETTIVLPSNGIAVSHTNCSFLVTNPNDPDSIPDENEFTPVDQEPIPINMDEINRNIIYPKALRDSGIYASRVAIRILVDKTGKPIKHVVKRTDHQLLSNMWIEQYYKLRFKPAISAGKPVYCWITLNPILCLRR